MFEFICSLEDKDFDLFLISGSREGTSARNHLSFPTVRDV